MKPPSGIEFDNEEHGRVVGALAPCGYNPALDHVISRTIGGEFAGAVVYQGYIADGSINLHAAARDPRWWNRDMAFAVFAYPFMVLRVRVCLITVLASNERSLRFCRGLGFQDEHVVPDAAPGGGIMLLSMRQSTCRWLQGPPPKGFLQKADDDVERWQRAAGA